MRHNLRAHRCPIVEPFRIGQRKVHATVTHRRPKVIVPICTMQAVAPIKVHRVWDIGQIISRPAHGCGDVFNVDAKCAHNGRRGPRAGGGEGTVYGSLSRVSGDGLCGQIDINPFFATCAVVGGWRGLWLGRCSWRIAVGNSKQLPHVDSV